jgi:DNA polymerase-3 subunit epsilon
MARLKYPGARNSLDALCQRYGIDNSHREKHGALLDSELLAEVYIELIGGKQASLGLADARSRDESADAEVGSTGEKAPWVRSKPLGSRLTPEERGAHADFIGTFKAEALWKRFGS